MIPYIKTNIQYTSIIKHSLFVLAILLHSNKPISNGSWPVIFNESLERFGIIFRHEHSVHLIKRIIFFFNKGLQYGDKKDHSIQISNCLGKYIFLVFFYLQRNQLHQDSFHHDNRYFQCVLSINRQV